MADQITNLPVSAIEEDPDNTRKTYNPVKLQELADSIEQQGVMQPIVVRPLYPNGDAPTPAQVRYRVIFGHRRLRATLLAGIEWIPSIIRELSAEQAAVAQLIENAQREDVTALEEAEGFRRLIDEFGVKVAEIIERTGKSKAFVYGRLKLLQLTAAPRQALEAGQIDAEVAGIISRMPAAVQADALDEVLIDGAAGPQGMSYREAKAALRHLIVDLAEAPFPVDVVGLAEKPACTACGDRAGNDPAMSDMDPMSCARRSCYSAKVHAWVQQQVDHAKASGRRVIEGEEAAQVLRYGIYSLWNFVRADEPGWVAQGVKMTPRELMQAAGLGEVPTILLVVPPDRGLPRLIEVYEESTHREAARDYIAKLDANKAPAQGGEEEGRMGEGAPDHAPETKRREALLALLTPAERCAFDQDHWIKVLQAVASRVRQSRRTVDDLRMIVLNQLDLGAEFTGGLTEQYMGLTGRFDGMGNDDRERAGVELAASMSPDDLAAALVLWALEDDRTLSWRAYEDADSARAVAMRRLSLARRYGVDVFNPEELVQPPEPVQTHAQVADLFDAKPGKTPSTAARAAQGAKSGKPAADAATGASTPSTAAPAATRAKAAPVKYRCPMTHATWSGRGVQPAWVRAALASGKTLAELEVREQKDEAGSAGNDQSDNAGVTAGQRADKGAQ